MKNHKLIIGLEIFLIVAILSSIIVFASEPGSSTDPIVTKSYVDDQISKVLESIEGTSSDSTTTSTTTDALAYTPVYVSTGQSLIGKEGTEIILRTGKGTAIVPSVDGIPDITSGTDLTSDESITINHLLIIPRDDGRGVLVTENAWFLVKGDYEIE